ncbi:E3 ubiquitin/ISG15 ligase TRIM25 [Oreochromis niloticus]|uniref:Tripartite motif containing 25 n=1 Tax=Oreochromis niloticus TaxID=8128 RepID=I3J5R1_ORENI|nr:E3 ubiquitin/ISG15 ligase TRIM25 [Oreochromis niloticus]
MAEVDESQFSIMSLEDELTCSICLSTFDCPVTIPCGHNFCQDCLLATWKESYSCPQCRTLFATRPELKKNTVLTAVVETFKVRSSKSEPNLAAEESQVKKKEIIRCDTCMEAEASKTCFTCMASYCEEHLRPHRENPIFRPHQLSEPVGDLLERICSDHHKLKEFFCSQHDRLICSFCLQQVHKGCSFISPEEQRNLKESDLRDKLGLLNEKMEKTETVVFQINTMQSKLKDGANKRKTALAAVYQQMRDILAQDEREAQTEVDRELELGQMKLRDLMKKLDENYNKMGKAREHINKLLSQSQSMAFLQASAELPKVVKIEPQMPPINLDSRKMIAMQSFAAALRETLMEMLKQPTEARLQLFKPVMCAGQTAAVSGPARTESTGAQPELEVECCPGQSRLPESDSPGPQAQKAKKKRTRKTKTKPNESTGDIMRIKKNARSMENLLEYGVKEKPRDCSPAAEPKQKPEAPDIPPDISTAEKRSELLKYGTELTFDPRTAHKRIVLTENFTKASVSDVHINYPDCPERFAVCSQVLTSEGFSTGRHYWEVRLTNINFVGIGLAYNSIDRKGPTSRLGRNAQSWSVEWFDVGLSVWHNSSETVLVNPNPKRVGVLLDCEAGTATFYRVAERVYPFHTIKFPYPAFLEAIYPAFWIFSNGSSITFCKMQP